MPAIMSRRSEILYHNTSNAVEYNEGKLHGYLSKLDVRHSFVANFYYVSKYHNWEAHKNLCGW